MKGLIEMISEKEIEKALNNTIEGQRKLLIAEVKKLMTEIKPYFDKFVEKFNRFIEKIDSKRIDKL